MQNKLILSISVLGLVNEYNIIL